MSAEEAGLPAIRSAGVSFTTTHWSVVLEAGIGDSSQAMVALEKLCRTYWYPLYAYVRRQGYNPEDAIKMTVLRLRQRYRELLRDEIAQTVGAPEEIEAELRYLRFVLRG